MIKKALIKLFDFYYRYPLSCDLVFILILWKLNKKLCFVPILEIDYINQISSSLVDTSVSLAGFILAALTIIVSFKSNLKAKGVEEAVNALEMIFSSSSYKDIVKTFKSSITELCLVFTILYVHDFYQGLFINLLNTFVVFSSLILISFALFRSLYLLFKVLSIAKSR